MTDSKKKPKRQLTSGTNPLADIDDGLLKNYQRSSSDLIYETIMRGGGEPFGRPFALGVNSLTERIVKLFRQRGFFRFETLDKPKTKRHRNKFTRYGASPYRGEHKKKGR
ncbi:MAG: hypothetical protein V3T05_02580 [Myxococcota bacterium]